MRCTPHDLEAASRAWNVEMLEQRTKKMRGDQMTTSLSDVALHLGSEDVANL